MTKASGKKGSRPSKRRGRSPPSSKAAGDAMIRLRERMRAIEARCTHLQSQYEYMMQEVEKLITDKR